MRPRSPTLDGGGASFIRYLKYIDKEETLIGVEAEESHKTENGGKAIQTTKLAKLPRLQ